MLCSLPFQSFPRWTRICGTKGELRWDGSARNAIEVHDFATGRKSLVYPDSIGRSSSDILSFPSARKQRFGVSAFGAC